MSAFIMEQPNVPGSKKRHPGHLIVACDRCRRKKLKCVAPQAPTVPCDNCARLPSAGAECTFGDRQRYLAERENTILAHVLESGPSGASSSSSCSSGVMQFDDPTLAATTGSTTTNAPQASVPLFDDYGPHTALMPRFIEEFFRIHGQTFPFLSHERTVSDFLHSNLPVDLASAIALLATPHCADIGGFDVQSAATQYYERTKYSICIHWEYPTIPAIQALMLLHHYEQSQGGVDAARAYVQRAYEMGAALNLNDDATIRLLSNTEDGQLRLRALWEAVRQ